MKVIPGVEHPEPPYCNKAGHDKIQELHGALAVLHDSMLEYGSINRLGGHNNHELRRARVALGLDEWLDIKDVEARFPPKAK